MDIQWYPGHMTKSIRMMEEQIALVDIVIELLDARAPRGSKNPDIDRLARNKKRLLILNKADLADPSVTNLWVRYYSGNGFSVITADSKSGSGLGRITDICLEMMSERIEREKKRGRIFVPVRAMVAGVPNVGKSTLINRYVGKSPAKTGDKPGVTRGRQWIRLKRGFELLDTPGILWPKLDDPDIGVNLAITGAVSGNVTENTDLCLRLIEKLKKLYPSALTTRYGTETDGDAFSVLKEISRARGYEKKAGELDTERAALAVIGDFRAGKLGRVSLESP
ncbi:MAG: ribosome biogenesis GTPase YlqF [Clostridiales bacterium]|nr:ribosome biogenesis GTPase YlqF [Clostridiales bacterium]